MDIVINAWQTPRVFSQLQQESGRIVNSFVVQRTLTYNYYYYYCYYDHYYHSSGIESNLGTLFITIIIIYIIGKIISKANSTKIKDYECPYQTQN